jgi:hypothetical protein
VRGEERNFVVASLVAFKGARRDGGAWTGEVTQHSCGVAAVEQVGRDVHVARATSRGPTGGAVSILNSAKFNFKLN